VALKELLDQPMLDLGARILNDPNLEVQMRAFISDGIEILFDTVLSGRNLLNVLKQTEFTQTSDAAKPHDAPPASDTQGDPAEVFVIEFDWVDLDPTVHAHFGKAVVRAMRSLVDWCGQLGAINTALLYIINKWCANLGKKILEGDSADLVSIIEKVLFKAEDGNGEEPGLFKNWTENETQLREEFRSWVENKLMKFVRQAIEASVPWIGQKLAEWEAKPLVDGLVAQIERVLFEPDHTSLKILLFHYLRPILEKDILVALSPSTR
jgi:hypothetical protein